jgi:hypothetical protein
VSINKFKELKRRKSMTKSTIAVVFFAIISSMGCREQCKTIGKLRCKGVEVCASDSKWMKHRNCATIPKSWCGDYNGTITCVIQKEKK